MKCRRSPGTGDRAIERSTDLQFVHAMAVGVGEVLLQRPRLIIVDGQTALPMEMRSLWASERPWTLLWIGELGHPLLRDCTSLFSVENSVVHRVAGWPSGQEPGGR